jgi:hypothetical protein
MPVGVPSRRCHCRDEQEQRGDRDGAQGGQGRRPIERARRGNHEGEAQHQEQVPDDGSRERGAHDVGQALGDGDKRDDELRGVAEARVEQAADPGPGVVSRLLRGLADEPRERDQRSGGKQELGGLTDAGNQTPTVRIAAGR